MKYIVILGDGMADEPIAALGNKTPLQVAHKPTMDKVTQFGQSGLLHTVPAGFHHRATLSKPWFVICSDFGRANNCAFLPRYPITHRPRVRTSVTGSSQSSLFTHAPSSAD